MGMGIKFLTLGILVSAAASASPEIVNVSVTRAFVPIGFDDNDKVEFAVQGAFPDTCFKIGPTNVHFDESKREIHVQQSAYKYPGFCLQMLVPFTQVVSMGIVSAGRYELRDDLTLKPLGSLPVERATTPSADDFLYAPVNDAWVENEGQPGKATLTLKGTFTDRCSRLKEVRLHYYADVVVVQPIAEHIGTRDCGPQLTRFAHTVELKPGLKGSFLFHVRSMNGQAINRIAELGAL